MITACHDNRLEQKRTEQNGTIEDIDTEQNTTTNQGRIEPRIVG